MRVFVSWSGNRSKAVALALKLWLKDVLQALEPWVSSEDIDKGARWNLQLSEGLETTSVGIVCITPENVGAPWILFESGALAKFVQSSRVCTYLYEIRPSDVNGPLAAFQATQAEKEDTHRLVKMLNRLLADRAIPEEQLNRTFEQWWPELEQKLKAIPKESVVVKRRTDSELLEEVLNLIRRQERLGASMPEVRMESAYIQNVLEFDPAEFNQLIGAFEVSHPPKEKPTSVPRMESFEGTWESEWSGGPATTLPVKGTAKVMVEAEFMVAMQIDLSRSHASGPYLLVAELRDDSWLVGRYLNLRSFRDSTAWVGRLSSEDRIEGQWAFGRWDFRRLVSVQTQG